MLNKDLTEIINYYKKAVSIEIKKEDSHIGQGLFYMEKQLEDFIIENWDKTEFFENTFDYKRKKIGEIKNKDEIKLINIGIVDQKEGSGKFELELGFDEGVIEKFISSYKLKKNE